MASIAVNCIEPSSNLVFSARPGAVDVYLAGEDSVSWSPHPNLVPGIRNRLEAVGRLPSSWLTRLQDGEVLNTAEQGQQRVLCRSLASGLRSVGGQGSYSRRKNIWCIHHGEKTRNDRDLSFHIGKNYADNIISTRKRENTRPWAKSFKCCCFLVPCVDMIKMVERLIYGSHPLDRESWFQANLTNHS
jgi:hypothetical protein